MVGKETDGVEPANPPEDVLPRTEDPENKLVSKERIGLLPSFPGQYEYVVRIC